MKAYCFYAFDLGASYFTKIKTKKETADRSAFAAEYLPDKLFKTKDHTWDLKASLQELAGGDAVVKVNGVYGSVGLVGGRGSIGDILLAGNAPAFRGRGALKIEVARSKSNLAKDTTCVLVCGYPPDNKVRFDVVHPGSYQLDTLYKKMDHKMVGAGEWSTSALDIANLLIANFPSFSRKLAARLAARG